MLSGAEVLEVLAVISEPRVVQALSVRLVLYWMRYVFPGNESNTSERFPPGGAASCEMCGGATTTTVKVLVAANVGEPLSVTRTVIVFVLGACATVGVQVKTPLPELM